MQICSNITVHYIITLPLQYSMQAINIQCYFKHFMIFVPLCIPIWSMLLMHNSLVYFMCILYVFHTQISQNMYFATILHIVVVKYVLYMSFTQILVKYVPCMCSMYILVHQMLCIYLTHILIKHALCMYFMYILVNQVPSMYFTYVLIKYVF